MEENKPKKSKAAIITFILILLLLVAGYFLFFSGGTSGLKSSTGKANFFSSLFTTKTSENDKTFAQAGEDIKDKNSIYVSGYVESSKSIPRVMKVNIADPNSSKPNNVYGQANQNINLNDLGKVTVTIAENETKRLIVEAGENIKEGDNIYIASYVKYTKEIPIVKNMGDNKPDDIKNNGIFGFANQDIKYDNIGEVTLTTSSNPNGFWNSIFSFLNIKDKDKTPIEEPTLPQISIENGVWKGTDPFKDSRVVISNGVWQGTNPQDGTISQENGVWMLNKSIQENGVWELKDGVWSRVEIGNWEKINPYNFPIVSVTANPSSFEKEGISTISWTATNATTCDSSAGGGNGTTGTFKTELLKKSQSYTVTCLGPNGLSSGTTFVVINGDSNFPMVTVMANPSSFEKEGVSTVSWTSTNATACFAGVGNGTGTTGSFSTGLVTKSKSFSVTCTGANGSRSGGNTSVIIIKDASDGIIRQCSDGLDNDGDGKIDINDPHCHVEGNLNNEYVPNHFSEATSPITGAAQCSDGLDNDRDGGTDATDPNCHEDGDINKAFVPTHFSESSSPFSVNAQCSDGKDNDKDGKIDFRDPNCHEDGDINKAFVPTHFSEASSPVWTGGIAQCSDTKDNDKDDKIDEADPNCHEDGNLAKAYIPSHYTETISPDNGTAQCSDGKDNDIDNLIDILDPSCHLDGDITMAYIPTHFSEKNPPISNTAQCSDGMDNDGDNKIDFEDLNCHEGGIMTGKYIPTHYSEKFSPNTNKKYQCSDGMDNDGDNKIDVADPNCHISGDLDLEYILTHNSESSSPTQCDDTKDNDGDNLIDILDPSCHIDGDITLTYIPTHFSEEFSPGGIAQCNDKKDNDGDKAIDILDPNCHVGGDLTLEYIPTHFSELNSPTQCSDKKDNDNDKKIDEKDPNCHIGGNMNGAYISVHNSELNSPTQCSDGADNDDDKLVDAADPQCHEGGDLNNPYVINHDSEKTAPDVINKCLGIEQNPLTFTPEEKARLAVLLRKFYLVSSTLKTGDDITTIYNEIDQQENFISQIKDLTNQCYAEIDNNIKYPNMMSDNQWKRHGNPWYTKTSGGSFPYTNENTGYLNGATTEQADTERILNIW